MPSQNFDAAAAERHTPRNKRSSTGFSPNGGLLGPPNKRQAVGRDDGVENGSYGFTVGRFSDSSSLRCSVSSADNGNESRDIMSGRPSAGYSGSPDTQMHNKDLDGHDFSVPFADGRLVSGSTPDLAFRPSGGEGLASWDQERSIFSSPLKWTGRTWNNGRTAAVPKLELGGDQGLEDGKLQERLDRYGSASNRELAFPDALSGSKEHFLNHSRGRNRALFSSFSLRTPQCSFNNSYMKDVGDHLHESELSGTRTSPQHSPFQSLAAHDSGCDDAGHASPRKKPRLTWGQGLAKYEKEKVEVEPAVTVRSEEVCNHHLNGGLQEDAPTKGDHPVILRNGSLLAEIENKCPYADQNQRTEFSLVAGCVDLNSTVLQDSLICPQLAAERLMPATFEHSASATVTSISSVLHDSQALFLSHHESNSNLTKDLLMQQVEKVELEVEFLEKELVNLENKYGNHCISPNMNKVEVETLPLEQCNVHSAICAVNSLPEVLSTEHDPQACAVSIAMEGGKDTALLCATDTKEDFCGCSKSTDELVHSSTEELPPDIGVGSLTSYCQQVDVKLSKENRGMECLPMDPLPKESKIDQGTNVEMKRDFVLCILQANQEIAKQSFDTLAHLLPYYGPSNMGDCKLYGNPQDATVWRLNMERHERNMKLLQSKIAQKDGLLKFTERVLAVRFRALRETWKQGQVVNIQQTERVKASKHWEPGQRNGSHPPNDYSLRRLRHVFCPTLHDALGEGVQVVRKLLNEPPIDFQGTYLRMPSMLLGGKERAFHRFVTNNGLVEDPLTAEQERKIMNLWSVEEKNVFLDKFSLFGKDFRKISSFLELKTVADCVEFYYRNRKSEDFERVCRRHKLKKRRDYSHTSGHYLGTTTSANCRLRELRAGGAQGLTLIAAAAAAMSASSHISKVLKARNRVVECDGHFSAKCGSVDTPFDHFRGSVKCRVSEIPALVGLSSRSRPVNHAMLELRGCRKSNKLRSNSIIPVEKGSQGQLGMKGARSVHSCSSKGSEEVADLHWTDSERELFTGAVAMFGRDFHSISLHVGSKTQGQCKSFFSKTRKRLGLDQLVECYKATLEVNANSIDEIKQTGLQDINSNVDCSTAGVNAINNPQVTQTMESVQGVRTEQHLRTQQKRPNVEVLLLNKLSNVSKVNTVLEDDTCCENIVAVSALQTASGSGLIDDAILDTIYNHRTVPSFHDKGVKEEACPLIDRRNILTGTSLDSQMINGAPVDTAPSCAQEASLVCIETLEIETKPVDIKLESVAALLSMQDVSTTPPPVHKSGTFSGVPAHVPRPLKAASVAQPALVKDKSLKGVETKTRREPTSWTQNEKEKFVDIIRKHGRDWDRLRESLPAKSLTQIKTYFQNSKAKLGLVPEGIVCGSGRGIPSRKRKAENSDLNCSTVLGGPQKVPLQVDEHSLKVNPTAVDPTGAPGSHFVCAEVLTCGSLLGRSTGQTSENHNGAGNVFNMMGAAQSSTTVGLIPMVNPAGFTPPNFCHEEQPYVLSTSLKMEQHADQHNQQQAVTGIHQDLPIPVVQHLHNQATQQTSQRTPLKLQQEIQNMQQQAMEAALQPSVVLRHQQQELELTHRQVSLEFQQVVSCPPVQSHQQPSSEDTSQQPEGASNQVMGKQRSTLVESKAGDQRQEQVGWFQSQFSSNPQTLLQQQPILQQLQLHLDQHELWKQCQDHSQQHIQPHQPSGNVKMQQQIFYPLHEQKQLDSIGGVMQTSSISLDVPKQCNFGLQNLVLLQEVPCKGMQQPLVVPQVPTNALLKSQAAPGMGMPVADVKLFGQLLLLPPGSTPLQATSKASSSTSSQLPTCVASTAEESLDAALKSYGAVGAPLLDIYVPCISQVSTISRPMACKSEPQCVQEAVTPVVIQEARSLESGHTGDMTAVTGFQDRQNIPNILVPVSAQCIPSVDVQNGSKSCDLGNLPCERSADFKPLSAIVPAGQVASLSLPHVLDALVGQAEWQSQCSSSSSGKLTEEFLSQSWEALQCDPGPSVEAAKDSEC